MLPVIEAAHKQGYYVITADYLPDNIAHKYSDEYVNVSVIDKYAVLAVAKEKQIDGIMSFGVDPGVVTAAYVQEKMGLPAFGPFASIEILQNKDKFRQFLKDNGFNVPWSFSFSSASEGLKNEEKFSYPLIVKPTDSAGSKGVTRVDRKADLKQALEHALEHSIKGKVIVEEFIEKQGCSSDSDCFSVDGYLKFVSFSAQRFDNSGVGKFVPAAYSWPSTMSKQQESVLYSELQRLLNLLKMRTSVYNVETRVGENGKVYIMEVSPRGGGNRLSEMIRYGTGVDLITACVRASVGDAVDEIEQKSFKGHWAEIVLHTDKSGVFYGMEISEGLHADVIENDLWIRPGDVVERFEGANNAIGMLILRFETKKELEEALLKQDKWLKIVVK